MNMKRFLGFMFAGLLMPGMFVVPVNADSGAEEATDASNTQTGENGEPADTLILFDFDTSKGGIPVVDDPAIGGKSGKFANIAPGAYNFIQFSFDKPLDLSPYVKNGSLHISMYTPAGFSDFDYYIAFHSTGGVMCSSNSWMADYTCPFDFKEGWNAIEMPFADGYNVGSPIDWTDVSAVRFLVFNRNEEMVTCYLDNLFVTMVSSDGDPVENPFEGQEKAPVYTETDTVKLASLTLDGGYTIAFDPDVRQYAVTLPDGDPRVPNILATAADSCTVAVTRPVFAAGEKTGVGSVAVNDGTSVSRYFIVFTKDRSAGFELQYNDRYTWDTGADGVLTYRSGNPDVITVENGVLTAKRPCDTAVTIEALDAAGKTVATLTVDRVQKAQVNIVMLSGQSNAMFDVYGDPADCVDAATGCVYHWGHSTGYNICDTSQTAMADLVLKVIDRDYVNTNAFPDSEGHPSYKGKAGGQTGVGYPFAKYWYDNTGEKTILVHTGYGGSLVGSWTPGRLMYDNAMAIYDELMKNLAAGEGEYGYFEINRRFYLWLQGESDVNTPIGHYQRQFLKMHKGLTNKGFELCAIILPGLLVGGATWGKPQEALLGIGENVSDAYVVSQLGPQITKALHFDQQQYNQLGEEAATALAKHITIDADQYISANSENPGKSSSHWWAIAGGILMALVAVGGIIAGGVLMKKKNNKGIVEK